MFLAFVPYGTPPSNAPDPLRGYFFTCIEIASPPDGRPVQGYFSWPAAEAVRPRLLIMRTDKRLRPLRRWACGPNCRQDPPFGHTPYVAIESPDLIRRHFLTFHGIFGHPPKRSPQSGVTFLGRPPKRSGCGCLRFAREDSVQGQAASAAALQRPVVAGLDSVPGIGSGFWALPKEPEPKASNRGFDNRGFDTPADWPAWRP